MLIPHSPYRRFFVKFTLLMPLLAAFILAVTALLTMVHYTAVVMVITIAVAFVILSLPATAVIAWIASQQHWQNDASGVWAIGLTAFLVSLSYELLIMLITDLWTHQVGSYFHFEVVIVAIVGMLTASIGGKLWLPKPISAKT